MSFSARVLIRQLQTELVEAARVSSPTPGLVCREWKLSLVRARQKRKKEKR
jgi:hypothetical protein